MANSLAISANLLEEIVSHSREEAPNECCGLIGGRNGQATSVHRAENVFASPLRYEIDPQDQFRILMALDESGEELAGIYHSHTGSEAYPSQTDRNLAENWPDPLYVICSVADPDEPEVRAFEIRDGDVSEAALDVG